MDQVMAMLMKIETFRQRIRTDQDQAIELGESPRGGGPSPVAVLSSDGQDLARDAPRGAQSVRRGDLTVGILRVNQNIGPGESRSDQPYLQNYRRKLWVMRFGGDSQPDQTSGFAVRSHPQCLRHTLNFQCFLVGLVRRTQAAETSSVPSPCTESSRAFPPSRLGFDFTSLVSGKTLNDDT